MEERIEEQSDVPFEVRSQYLVGHKYHDLIIICVKLELTESENLSLWKQKVEFDINQSNNNIQQYFNQCCIQGWTICVSIVLTDYLDKMDINYRDCLPLVNASYNNHSKIVEILLPLITCD